MRPDDPDITANLNNPDGRGQGLLAYRCCFGEFGFTPKAAQYQATINAIYAQTNKTPSMNAQWLWKEESQDSWGFFDYSTGTPVLRRLPPPRRSPYPARPSWQD